MVRRVVQSDVGAVLLLCVLTALVVFQYAERRQRSIENQRQICAIRQYIEGQFHITATLSSATPLEVAARRAVIQTFENRMDGNC